jgi:uncharacterized protein YydD (DUF2326 family)
MILRVWSDLDTFREVSFQSGLNMVLADKTDDSEETESTNGLGKTMLIRIIHFCLGSDLARDKALSHPKLKGVTFGLDLLYEGSEVSASRNTAAPLSIHVSPRLIDGLSIEVERATPKRATISLDAWKDVLTRRFVPGAAVGGSTPTFREIALYLIRLGKPAFADPTIAFQGQSGASKRLTTSYLLGLNWAAQKKLQDLLDTRKRVGETIQALKEAESSANDKSIGDLDAERVALEATVSAKRSEVEGFKVREDYRDLERHLGDVDLQLHELVNENYSDRRLLDHYQESAEELPEADPNKPISILKKAGAIFNPQTLKTLNEIASFHAEVHKNRKAFLQGEISRLKEAINVRGNAISSLSNEKTRVLGVLKSSGALETLIELQRSYTEQTSRLEALKARISERRRFDLRKEEIAVEVSQARALMKRDADDRAETIDEARRLFSEFTKFLYGKPGGLAVDISTNGYKLTFTIDRSGSDGVDQMVVFCFDLTVATLRARRSGGFVSLVHDSSLFADVDPRQYGLALQLAEKKSKAEGFQYICCLNSGTLPMMHLGELDFSNFVRLRLTDHSEDGRLLGMQLPPIENAA